MHKNYNSCLHILDMHLERGGGIIFHIENNSSSFQIAPFPDHNLLVKITETK